MSGFFITFEGVDGCGKTTQRRRTAAWLRELGLDVLETFEPGDTPLGREIRRLLLHEADAPVPEAELLLFLADRVQHVRRVIAPALERGQIVLCDRYTDSTLAYQLAGRSLDAEAVTPALRLAEAGVRPHLTLWFDLPVREALARMRQREQTGEAATRMDGERQSFHEAVRAGFAQLAEREPGRIRRVDAAGDVETVQRRVRSLLLPVLESRGLIAGGADG